MNRLARLASIALLATLALVACSPAACDHAYDEASNALAERIEAIPANRALREAVDRRLAEVDGTTGAIIARRLAQLHIAVLRVPGLLYRSHPQSGGNLEAVNHWLGEDVPLADVDEVGTVEGNAEVVAAAIRRAAKDGETVALLSASKGSADVLAALETHPELGSRVAIWIDLVGILEGTPLTNPGSRALEASDSWLPPATAASMSEKVRRDAASRRSFPEAVRAIHVAAFPTAEHVSADASDAFRLLRNRGPTDGYVLLDAYLRAPGRVLVLRGTDHYLRTPRLPPLVAAAMLVTLDEIQEARHR